MSDSTVQQAVTNLFPRGDNSNNDLAVVVVNNTSSQLQVGNTIEHGDFANTTGDSTVAAMPADGSPTVYGVAATAAGNGSGVFITITSASTSGGWGVYARTPPGASNYVQCLFISDNGIVPSYDAVSEYGIEQSSEVLAGPTSGTEVAVTISGEAPAVVEISFQAS